MNMGKPEMEVLRFGAEDVIATSNGVDYPAYMRVRGLSNWGNDDNFYGIGTDRTVEANIAGKTSTWGSALTLLNSLPVNVEAGTLIVSSNGESRNAYSFFNGSVTAQHTGHGHFDGLYHWEDGKFMWESN